MAQMKSNLNLLLMIISLSKVFKCNLIHQNNVYISDLDIKIGIQSAEYILTPSRKIKRVLRIQ